MVRWARRNLRRWVLLTACGAAILSLRFFSRPAPFARDPQQMFRVERVIDGDTLRLPGGERVRLLGIDTPELARDGKPAEPLAQAARDFLNSAVDGREISLGFDREARDKYGRQLAYVYVQGTLINEEIIRAGFSRAETRFPYQASMKARFRRAEREARERQRGLWSP
jgi:micrococcal nuclease